MTTESIKSVNCLQKWSETVQETDTLVLFTKMLYYFEAIFIFQWKKATSTHGEMTISTNDFVKIVDFFLAFLDCQNSDAKIKIYHFYIQQSSPGRGVSLDLLKEAFKVVVER